MDACLRPTYFFDYDQPDLRAWIEKQVIGVTDDPLEQIKALYLAVQDQVAYNPYVCRPEAETFRASHALLSGESYCIPKAVLLGAAARAIGVPSRLGLADVRNHLSSPRLIEWLQSDIFRMHGFIELYLNGRWVKATPAFNERLCRLIGVEPLEFDGLADSVFQPYTADGKAHMEYVFDHGVFDDVPHDYIVAGLRQAYGHLFEGNEPRSDFRGSLEGEIAPGNRE
ncbi:transglutaminase-like domain-containing protein [Marinobacteraceae bacterium S3BR75-40.1]